MKKILFLFVTLSISVTSNAQLLGSLNLDPKDFLETRNTKKELILDSCLLNDILCPVFFLSRQSFQVCDKNTGELYGLNNKNEFGTEITLGVKVKGGYVLTDKALHPWKYNDKFGTYKDSYDPVPFQSEYSEVEENTRYDSLDIAQDHVNDLLQATCYLIKSNCLAGQGLDIDSMEGAKVGWAVWTIVDDDKDLNKTARLTLICSNNKLEAKKDGKVDVEAPDGKKALGGIYVVPTVTGIGVLEFRLCGIMVESDGKWCIRFPFIGNEKLFMQESKSQVKDKPIEESDKKTESTDDLYPVNPQKKNNKKKNKK